MWAVRFGDHYDRDHHGITCGVDTEEEALRIVEELERVAELNQESYFYYAIDTFITVKSLEDFQARYPDYFTVYVEEDDWNTNEDEDE